MPDYTYRGIKYEVNWSKDGDWMWYFKDSSSNPHLGFNGNLEKAKKAAEAKIRQVT